jgi:hypothetical protein
MPYIVEHRKIDLDDGVRRPDSPGELNYVLTKVAMTYLKDQTLYKGDYMYVDLNDIIGAFEAAKLEFYRRVVVPYEEQKRFDNGDVYGR